MSKTVPKAQRIRGLKSAYQSNFFRSYHKFSHKSWWNFIFRILNKHQLQNLNQSSAFRLNSNIKILNKPSFTISTKIKFHNLNQASAAKYWPIISSGVSINLKTWVFYKGWYRRIGFFISRPYAVFYIMKVDFAKCNKLKKTPCISKYSSILVDTISYWRQLSTLPDLSFFL